MFGRRRIRWLERELIKVHDVLLPKPEPPLQEPDGLRRLRDASRAVLLRDGTDGLVQRIEERLAIADRIVEEAKRVSVREALFENGGYGERIDNVRAAELLNPNLAPDARVLPEVLAGTDGMRFQWKDGTVLDWFPGEGFWLGHDERLAEEWKRWEENRKKEEV